MQLHPIHAEVSLAANAAGPDGPCHALLVRFSDDYTVAFPIRLGAAPAPIMEGPYHKVISALGKPRAEA